MEKLVIDYTYCSEPECWEWNIPFEYKSKEKFIFDVLENNKLLNKIGIDYIPDDLIRDLDEYVFTLDEWFNRNKYTI
jgi:hypothetical protein